MLDGRTGLALADVVSDAATVHARRRAARLHTVEHSPFESETTSHKEASKESMETQETANLVKEVVFADEIELRSGRLAPQQAHRFVAQRWQVLELHDRKADTMRRQLLSSEHRATRALREHVSGKRRRREASKRAHHAHRWGKGPP